MGPHRGQGLYYTHNLYPKIICYILVAESKSQIYQIASMCIYCKGAFQEIDTADRIG